MKTCRRPPRLCFLGSWWARALSRRRATAECAAARCPLQRGQKRSVEIRGRCVTNSWQNFVEKTAMWSHAPIPVASLISSRVNSSPSLNISSTSVWKSDTCNSFLPFCGRIKNKNSKLKTRAYLHWLRGKKQHVSNVRNDSSTSLNSAFSTQWPSVDCHCSFLPLCLPR